MAMLLRPQEASGGKGGQSSAGHLPTFVVYEDGTVDNQIPHDVRMLPHMYGQDEMNRLFPVLEAPAQSENVEDWKPECVH